VVDTETGRVARSVGAHGKPDDVLELEARLAEKLRSALGRGPLDPARDGPAVAVQANASSTQGPANARAKVHVSAVAAYGRALEALDRHDAPAAKKALRAAVTISPGFTLAEQALAHLPM